MIETEISKINKRICEKIIIIKMKILLIISPEDPKRESNKWPAIIFAVRRIAKVKGRIIKLIDSIITIKGIKIYGVPWGVKWANNSFKYLNILYIIMEIQRVNDNERQNLRCLEDVKI